MVNQLDSADAGDVQTCGRSNFRQSGALLLVSFADQSKSLKFGDTVLLSR